MSQTNVLCRNDKFSSRRAFDDHRGQDTYEEHQRRNSRASSLVGASD